MCCFWHSCIDSPCRRRRRPFGCARCADTRDHCGLGGVYADCGCGPMGGAGDFDRYDESSYCCDRL